MRPSSSSSIRGRPDAAPEKALASVKTQVVPEACGDAIPTNSKDLLLFIKHQKQQRSSGYNLKSQQYTNTILDPSQERQRRQDEVRSQLEFPLMENEDILSSNLATLFKEYDAQRFRDKLHKQVEAREAAERAEREARIKAAEERRAAVVERLRQQKEREEQRKRDAELALIRIQEEKQRKEQAELDRLASDKALMPYEDQLSMLAEQDYRELIERQKWQQREKERLLLWETEQREKDKIADEQRALRAAELDEKKRKLDALRQQQQLQQAEQAAKMKEENDRLNRQMRVQNKAKFVTRKLAAAPIPAPEVLHETAITTDNRTTLAAVPGTEVAVETDSDDEQKQRQQQNLTQIPATFLAELSVVEDEKQLRGMLQTLMQEKRGLRLEQRQRLSHDIVNHGEEEEEETKQLLLQLQIATMKSEVVEQRIESMQTRRLQTQKEQQQQREHQQSTEFSTKQTTPVKSETNCTNTSNGLLLSIEAILQETQNPNLAHTRIPTLLMEITRLLQALEKQGNDPLDHSEKLKNLEKELRATLLQNSNSDIRSSPRITKANSDKTTKSNHVVTNDTASSAVEMKTSRSTPTVVTPTTAETTLVENKQLPDENNIKVIDDDGKNEDDNNEEDEVNPEKLPGWFECINSSMFSAAHHAAYFGHVQVLSFLCQYFDVFVMDTKGRSPLFHAALANKLDCVATLLALDPQWMDVGDYSGDTPVHAASIANGVETLSFLLSCEANPDTANHQGLTPSHLARHRKALQVLHKAGAQLFCIDAKSRMPLWFACSEGRADCVTFLSEVTPSTFLLWPDSEGETCLHIAAAKGHGACVEALCQRLPNIEDLYTLNARQHTAAHVASNAAVLRALYENGANLWQVDSKSHAPLFLAAFFGRADCVSILLDFAVIKAVDDVGDSSRPTSSVGSRRMNSKANNKAIMATVTKIVAAKDSKGDTALHVAALCGHVACVSLLLYYIPDEPNLQGLKPSDLARKAGHAHIADLLVYIDRSCRSASSTTSIEEAMGCERSTLATILLQPTSSGLRWQQGYDSSFEAMYYIDGVTGASQWERPITCDLSARDETRFKNALDLLKTFYKRHNPTKLSGIGSILQVYRGRYSELFITLADRYQLQGADLAMFAGVNLD